MQFPKQLLITVLMFGLAVPNEAGWWRSIKEVLCKLAFTIVCPLGVNAVVGTFDTSQAATAFLLKGGHTGCSVGQQKLCKRSVSVPDGLEYIPFSDNFCDYDINGDKLISYEEFRDTVTAFVGLIDPDQLFEPFVFADANDDNMIDKVEFGGAPFMFAHISMKMNGTEILPANRTETLPTNCA